jgi:resuscitation-promoting factor RpfB
VRVHLRRSRSALPAHVERVIGPSPARAEPHDAAAWLPVPDPHGLPSIEMLLENARSFADAAAEAIDLVALEAMVSPSPARAEPHDAATWLPLPDDVHVLPSVHDLRDPHPEVQAAVVAEAEALVAEALAAAEASSAPSPARAEPHDPTSWLPLPTLEELPPVAELLDEGAPPATAGRRRTRLLPPARLVFITLLVVATVLAGGWAVNRLVAPGGSQVSLVVDGSRQEMRTDFKTVGALLAAEHVRLGAGDAVVPPASTGLHDGLHIDVLRAFPVGVDVDGVTRTVRTVEHSADGLAKQLKLGKLAAVRNQPGRLVAGSTVVFRTRISGSLKIDNQTVTFDSPSRTVDELLQSYNVQLVGDDYVLPPLDTVLADGATVAVVRVGADVTQDTERIPFDTVQQADPTLPIGQTRVIQEGRDGTLVVTYRQQVVNGAKGDRTVLSKVPSVEPTPKIIGYGTQADPHWDELAQCESGGRWDTVDSSPNGFDGGLGIARSTWRAWGGTEFAPNAGLATREQQIVVGMRIYADLGWDPWGCANNVLHWPTRTS